MSKKRQPKPKPVKVVSATHGPDKRTRKDIEKRLEATAPGHSVPFKPGEKDYEEHPQRPRGFKR